jgi:radical SAM superfamily enzyme YgiQ (UPF0313 family)
MVLLVNPPAVSEPSGQTLRGESFISAQKRRMTPRQYYSLPFEHLGIMSIASFARAQGITVDTVNGMLAGHVSPEQTWSAVRAAVRPGASPELIGFTNIDTFEEVQWIAEQCRSQWPTVKIALGNVFATLNYERILTSNNLFDFICLGEGETTFSALAKAVLEGRGVENVPGLALRRDDGSISASAPTAITLDDLPWAARDELPAVLNEGFAASVFTSRGCPYRCTFCGTGAVSSGLEARASYRTRSIEGVVDEIEYLVKDYDIGFVSIVDDLFLAKSPSSQERAKVLADELVRRGLQIGFMFDARLDAVFDLRLFAHLKRAGLRKVFIGVETGSHEQLRQYNKRHLPDQSDPAGPIVALQEIGIEVIPGTIMFHPEVKRSELQETFRVLKAAGCEIPSKLVDCVTAYPGTPLHREYAAKGYFKVDWPIGQWEFSEHAASRMFNNLVSHIRQQPDMSFDAAESLFLAELAAWEQSEAISARELSGDRSTTTFDCVSTPMQETTDPACRLVEIDVQTRNPRP